MKTLCRHWIDCQVAGGGCCAIGRFGGRPSHGICTICPDYSGRVRGLGDLIHWFAHPTGQWINRLLRRNFFGGKTCNCQARRQRLNHWFKRNNQPPP